MKYFEEYVNEFQEYYCTIGEFENEDLVLLLYRKLPEPWRTTVKEDIELRPLERFSVGGCVERIRSLMCEQCKANIRSKAAKKHLKSSDNFCTKLIDVPTNWGCEEEKKKRRPFQKRFKRNDKKNWRFKKSSNYSRDRRNPKKRFFKRKSTEPGKKKTCRCWLCKSEGHYANECPKKDKRNSKALFEEYDSVVKIANMEGFEIAYSEDEDNMSVYSAWSEEDSSSEDSDLDFEEEECECRPICLLQVVNWEENTAKIPISSSYRVNPGTFICDHCQCHEEDGLPMYYEESGNTYHKESLLGAR